MHVSEPVHSRMVSKPSGAAKEVRMDVDVREARRRASSADEEGVGFVEEEGGTGQHPSPCGWCCDEPGMGRQKTSSANPLVLANSRRWGLMSTATTREAPLCFASAQARRPIAPTPNTRTDWPWVRRHRREAWMRTERGSASAACSNVQVSGRLLGC